MRGRTWPGFAKVITGTYGGDGKRSSRFAWDSGISNGDYIAYQYGPGFNVLNECTARYFQGFA